MTFFFVVVVVVFIITIKITITVKRKKDERLSASFFFFFFDKKDALCALEELLGGLEGMGTGLTEVGSLRTGGTLEGDTGELVTQRLEPLEDDFTRNKIWTRHDTTRQDKTRW